MKYIIKKVIIIAIMGALAPIGPLVYQYSTNDANMPALVFLTAWTIFTGGFAVWWVYYEERESAKLFLLGILLFGSIPWLLVFDGLLIRILEAAIIITGGLCIIEAFDRKKPAKPIAYWDGKIGFPMWRCPVCGNKRTMRTAICDSGCKDWV